MEKLTQQQNAMSLIRIYASENIVCPEIKIEQVCTGRTLTNEYFVEQLKAMELENYTTNDPQNNAIIVLKAFYACGIKWVHDLLADRLETLSALEETDKSKSKEYFKKLSKDIKQHLSIQR